MHNDAAALQQQFQCTEGYCRLEMWRALIKTLETCKEV